MSLLSRLKNKIVPQAQPKEIGVGSAMSAVEIYAQYKCLTVRIETPMSSGSGVVLTKRGMIATNHHVISGQSSAMVIFSSGIKVKCPVMYSDEEVDLAFLLLSSSDHDLTSLGPQPSLLYDKAPSSLSVSTGETVYAIGHPMGLDYSITQGVISSSERTIDANRFIQIDAAINPGNSGGPLYNSLGVLIGINTCSRADSQGINFAIPISIVYERLSKLCKLIEQNVTSYCTVCGHASLTPDYCDHCGAKIAKDSALSSQTNEQTDLKAPSEVRSKQTDKPRFATECDSCGAPNSGTSKYCTNCGSKLTSRP
jgi:serine protease Do